MSAIADTERIMYAVLYIRLLRLLIAAKQTVPHGAELLCAWGNHRKHVVVVALCTAVWLGIVIHKVTIPSTISNTLSELLRYLTVSECDLLFLAWIGVEYAVLTIRLAAGPVREECLVYFEQRLFVVNEQIEQVALIAHCEISQFHFVLR